MDPIVEQLRVERKQRKITQLEIAEKLGNRDHNRMLSVWERGEVMPRLDTLRRWADALGFDVVLVRREDPGVGS